MPTLTTFIQHSFGSPSYGREEKEKESKLEKKLSLFADDMIVYRENSKDATRKL